MSKFKLIIHAAGNKDKSMMVNKAEESVKQIDKYIAAFSSTDYAGESVLATEDTQEEFYIVLNKKRVTTVLLNRSGNNISESGERYYGDDFKGVALVLFRCKDEAEGVQYHLVYLQGDKGGYRNIWSDTYGMKMDLISVFKNFIKTDENIKCLPVYDRFFEHVNDTMAVDSGGERDEQEAQEID